MERQMAYRFLPLLNICGGKERNCMRMVEKEEESARQGGEEEGERRGVRCAAL